MKQGNISLWWWCPGNSDSLLAALPSNLSLAPNTSASVAVVPLKAGHVDIAAWPQEANIRWYAMLLTFTMVSKDFLKSWVGLKVQKKIINHDLKVVKVHHVVDQWVYRKPPSSSHISWLVVSSVTHLCCCHNLHRQLWGTEKSIATKIRGSCLTEDIMGYDDLCKCLKEHKKIVYYLNRLLIERLASLTWGHGQWRARQGRRWQPVAIAGGGHLLTGHLSFY